MREFRVRDSIPHVASILFRRVARVHNRAVRPFEVSAVQANILTTLWLEGPMTIGQLQAMLALGSSTLTGAIDRMEKAKLLKRVEVKGDRRAWRIEPADWPAKKRDGLLVLLGQTEDLCFSGLSGAERKELLRLLAKANDSIERVDDGDD